MTLTRPDPNSHEQPDRKAPWCLDALHTCTEDRKWRSARWSPSVTSRKIACRASPSKLAFAQGQSLFCLPSRAQTRHRQKQKRLHETDRWCRRCPISWVPHVHLEASIREGVPTRHKESNEVPTTWTMMPTGSGQQDVRGRPAVDTPCAVSRLKQFMGSSQNEHCWSRGGGRHRVD